MKLDVVSEDVLPSERLKRLLRLGNFLGSCDERDTHRWRKKERQRETSLRFYWFFYAFLFNFGKIDACIGESWCERAAVHRSKTVTSCSFAKYEKEIRIEWIYLHMLICVMQKTDFLRLLATQSINKKAWMLQCLLTGPVDSGYRWVRVMVGTFTPMIDKAGNATEIIKHQYTIHKRPDLKCMNIWGDVILLACLRDIFCICEPTLWSHPLAFHRSSINLQFQWRRRWKKGKKEEVSRCQNATPQFFNNK